MCRGDERPHLRRVVRGIAHPHAARRVDEKVEEAVVDRLLDQDARARAAVLARVVEDRVRRRGSRLLDVGVLEDHVRRLPSELERDALDRPGRALHDEAPDLRRPGECDLRDVGMLDQALPHDRALADEDVHDAVRNPGLEAQLAEPQRGERRQLGRLEDDRVATGERRPELPAGDVRREVPRDDEPDDAEWLTERGSDSAGHGDRLAAVLVDGSGVEVEDLRHHADLAARSGDRLAHVLRLDPSELLGVLLDQRRESPKKAASIGR